MPKQSMGLYFKPTRKLFGFLLLAATALVIALPASAYAADITVNDEVELGAAVAGAPATPYAIELGSDIDLAAPLEIPASTDITLTGDHSLTGADGHATITVEGTLTLDGITVTHNSGESGRGVTVQSGGTLILSSGAISGNGAYNGNGVYNGGGVYNSNNGTFIMKGGTISGNTVPYGGGGVYNRGTFTMQGGEISGNTATEGGGVYNVGTFTMEGGAISGNTAPYGGGVRNNGTFAMEGGSISGNGGSIGGGVYNSDSGTFTMQGGEISGNVIPYMGGGVYNAGTFAMEDGTISENTAYVYYGVGYGGGYGGGVYNDAGTFTMEDGAISENTADDGGGVFTDGGVFTMQGGKISRNVSDDWGGGVYNGGTFTMEGGTISENTASGGDVYSGGGVYNNGDFTMQAGEISRNVSDAYGGGVYNGAGTFTMEAGAISNNMAIDGGGVFNSNGDFTMEGGTISDNAASRSGGGVLNNGDFTMEGGAVSGNTATYPYSGRGGGGVYNGGTFTMEAGTISGNTATGDGGGIFTTDYAQLTVATDVVFSDNKAQAAYDRDPADDALYAAQIHGTVWTAPFTQGYNNYDINYTKGSLATVVTVTFDGNGGTVLPGDESREAIAGESLGANMPPDPTRDDEGLIFKGWNTALDGSGTAFTSSTAVEADITVYAQWDLATAPVTVAFDGNGGVVLPANETRTFNAGEPLGANMPPDPTWEGHLFTGWNMEPDGSGTAFTSETVLDADTVVYAQWEALAVAPAPVTVTFDGNGGVVLAGDKARTLDAGGSLGADMPPDPTRTRYDFTGWNTAPDGSGMSFTSSTVVDVDVTVYAQWAAQGEPAIPPTGDDAFQLYGLSALCLILASTGLIGITRRKKASGK